MDEKSLSIFTLTVHKGHPKTGEGSVPAAPSIVPSVGFIHPNMHTTDHALGSEGGSTSAPDDSINARHSGPTQAGFEDAIASLESTEAALSFSSGMAAIHAALLSTAPKGGSIIAAEQLYGTTR